MNNILKPKVNVVVALIWNNNKFLACHRKSKKNHGNKWEFVGGKIEEGETKNQALIRECFEELRIAIEPLDIFTETEYEYIDMKVHITVINAKIISGEPILIEHDSVKWISIDEIHNYEFSYADEEIINKIKNEFKF